VNWKLPSLAVSGAMAAFAITACSGSQTTVKGTLCSASDTVQQVTITDASHKVIGTAKLTQTGGSPGFDILGQTGPATYTYKFTSQVPAESRYGFEVSGIQGTYWASPSEVKHIGLTDGNC
jgi:hypothetical protein